MLYWSHTNVAQELTCVRNEDLRVLQSLRAVGSNRLVKNESY